MPGLLDFSDNPLAQLGGLLMSGTSPFFGVNAGNAINQQAALQMQQKKDARADQQAELSQLVQSYSILKQQDQQAQALAGFDGTPYVPNPLLKLHEQKLGQLMGLPTPSTPMSQAPQAPQQAPQPPQQPMPQGGPPMGQPAPMGGQGAPMGQPAPQAQAPVPMQGPQSNLTIRVAAQSAGIPEVVARNMIAQGDMKGLLAKIAEGLAAKNGPAGVTRINPSTGQVEIVAGNAQPGTVPFARDATGRLVAQPIQGAAEEVARAEALKTASTESAKAPYQMVTVPQSDGSTKLVPLSSLVSQAPQGQAGPPKVASLAVTQGPAAGSGASFGTSQTPAAKVTSEGLAKGGVDYKNTLDTTVGVGNDLMMRINESRKALSEFKPGMGSETRLNVARFADSMGAPKALVDRINLGDVSAKQEFMKLSAQQAMESLKQSLGGSGRITQAEFKVFQENNPNIALDPQAIDKIFNFAQRVHARNVTEQAALTNYLGQGGDLSKWPTVWTQTQAAQGYGSPPAQQQASTGVRKYNPATGRIE